MRKLKLQVQITVDGYIADTNGGMDFMVWNWDDQLNNYIAGIMESVDCILLGRKLAEVFIPHWAKVAESPDDPEVEAGKQLTYIPKVVFSKTLNQSPWSNTLLAKGDLKEEINRLKNQEGGDIMAYGGATFVSALIKEGLIDEFHLLVDPVIIGSGMPIFREVSTKQNLMLVKSTAFDCGIVVLHFVSKK